MIRKFVFISAMGDLLIHRDSSSVNTTPTNENFACEILQLFVLALITLNPDSSPLLEEHHDLFSVFSGLRAGLPRGIWERRTEKRINPMDIFPRAGSVSKGGS